MQRTHKDHKTRTTNELCKVICNLYIANNKGMLDDDDEIEYNEIERKKLLLEYIYIDIYTYRYIHIDIYI